MTANIPLGIHPVEIKTERKVFYSELPSRNIYVDSVVNALPGYYPARSEFNIEYNNDIEQDLTQVCALYDALVNNNGEEEETDVLKELLSKVKQEPDADMSEKCEENDFGQAEMRKPESDGERSHDTKTLRKRKGEPLTLGRRKNKRMDVKSGNVSCEKKIQSEDDGKDNKISASKSDEIRDRTKQDVVSNESEQVFKDLCLACIDIYNRRLAEREERKAFVRNHGFLDQKKVYSWYNIQSLEAGEVFNTLVKKFIKLFPNAEEFDKFMQQLKLEREMRMKLLHLEELRRNGIRHRNMIPLYMKMKAERNSMHNEIRNLDISDILVLSDHLPDTPVPRKRVFKTLEISHMENYKLLSEKEKELCAATRLTPVSYLSFKQILVDECKKLNGLKLAPARTMLKIDVNKTRKVYNHLIETKLIWDK